MRKIREIEELIADHTPLEAVPITDIPLEAVAPAPIDGGFVQSIPQPRHSRRPNEILEVQVMTKEMLQAHLYPEPKPLTAKEQKLQALVKTIPIKRDPKWDR